MGDLQVESLVAKNVVVSDNSLYVENFSRMGPLALVGALTATEDISTDGGLTVNGQTTTGVVLCLGPGQIQGNLICQAGINSTGLITCTDMTASATVRAVDAIVSGALTSEATNVNSLGVVTNATITGGVSAATLNVSGASFLQTLQCGGDVDVSTAVTTANLVVTSGSFLEALQCSAPVTAIAGFSSTTGSFSSDINCVNLDASGYLTHKKLIIRVESDMALTPSQSGAQVIFSNAGAFTASLPPGPPDGTFYDFVTQTQIGTVSSAPQNINFVIGPSNSPTTSPGYALAANYSTASFVYDSTVGTWYGRSPVFS